MHLKYQLYKPKVIRPVNCSTIAEISYIIHTSPLDYLDY